MEYIINIYLVGIFIIVLACALVNFLYLLDKYKDATKVIVGTLFFAWDGFLFGIFWPIWIPIIVINNCIDHFNYLYWCYLFQ